MEGLLKELSHEYWFIPAKVSKAQTGSFIFLLFLRQGVTMFALAGLELTMRRRLALYTHMYVYIYEYTYLYMYIEIHTCIHTVSYSPGCPQTHCIRGWPWTPDTQKFRDYRHLLQHPVYRCWGLNLRFGPYLRHQSWKFLPLCPFSRHTPLTPNSLAIKISLPTLALKDPRCRFPVHGAREGLPVWFFVWVGRTVALVSLKEKEAKEARRQMGEARRALWDSQKCSAVEPRKENV